MITNRQKNIIAFFITQSLFLNIGFYNILKITSTDSWISCIIGTLLGILFCFIIKNNYIFRIISVILSIIFVILSLYSINSFIRSFYLLNTSSILILLPVIILGIYISFKDYELLGLICEVLYPISLFLILFSFGVLIFKIDISNINIVLTHSNTSIFKSSIIYFILSTSPLLLLNDNNHIHGYILSSIILNITFILIITILGKYLIPLYRYPEYVILKNINIFNFVEKIENILIIPWILNLFILFFTSILNIKKRLIT